jgi:hypothetical protein
LIPQLALNKDKETTNMTKNNLYHVKWTLRATGVLLLALALSTFPMAFSRAVKAQTPAKAATQTPAQTAESPAVESKGGQKEGIKVHGHWAIDVRKPDGTLVSHREFENALTAYGGFLLGLILARDQTQPGPWDVQLIGSACHARESRFGTNCVIGEALNRDADFETLQVFGTGGSSGGGGLILQGTAQATQDGTITGVGTFSEGQCGNNVTPFDCIHGVTPSGFQGLHNGNYAPLTSATLVDALGQPAPLSVAAHQLIQVKVTISFS